MLRFIIDHTIGRTLVCGAASRITEDIVTGVVKVYVAKNVVEVFELTLIVMQTIPFLNSGFLLWLCDLLWPCVSNVLVDISPSSSRPYINFLTQK